MHGGKLRHISAMMFPRQGLNIFDITLNLQTAPQGWRVLHLIGTLNDPIRVIQRASPCANCDEAAVIKPDVFWNLEFIGEEFSDFELITGEFGGFMYDDSDRFGRLVYFSAVTAATIGYGDLVPTSRPARLIAAIQALVSIVTIGLFVNALSSIKAKP